MIRRFSLSRLSLSSLARCQRGNTVVEFALVLTPFLMILTGTMEYCRVLWTRQTLNNVAYMAARCATYSTSCSTSALTKSYAVTLASGYGLNVLTTNVTYTANTTCNTNTAQNSVVINYTFNSPLDGLEPAFPDTLTGTGCIAA